MSISTRSRCRSAAKARRSDERYNIQKARFKWFEGPIYKFINKNNEDSMRRASTRLTANPEYRPDLVDAGESTG